LRIARGAAGQWSRRGSRGRFGAGLHFGRRAACRGDHVRNARSPSRPLRLPKQGAWSARRTVHLSANVRFWHEAAVRCGANVWTLLEAKRKAAAFAFACFNGSKAASVIFGAAQGDFLVSNFL